MIVTKSASSYLDTVESLLAAIQGHGLTVFGRIDHAGAARDAGLEMADEEVVLFGSPKVGTPLMQADPRIGIELPLRMLVWAEGGDVFVAYNDPRELRSSYAVAGDAATLEAMATLLKALAAASARGE
jgi:uncharacterized protein (DUF302 family)